MPDVSVEVNDKLVNSVSDFFIVLSTYPPLIYLICGAFFCPFIYVYTKLILEKKSESRTDKLIEKNTEILLEVKEALGKIYSVMKK